MIWHDASQNQCNIHIDIDWHSKLSFTICWVKNYHYFIIRSWWYTLINSLMRLSKNSEAVFWVSWWCSSCVWLNWESGMKWDLLLWISFLFFVSLWMSKAELCRRGSDVLVREGFESDKWIGWMEGKMRWSFVVRYRYCWDRDCQGLL